MPNDGSPSSAQFVFSVIEKEARTYKWWFGVSPTITIDSTDHIAKTDRVLFRTLITSTNRLVNNKVANIGLVSSEGHVLPALDEQSERTRSAKIFHVRDISIADAQKLLIKNGLSQQVSEGVTELAGGRLVLPTDSGSKCKQ